MRGNTVHNIIHISTVETLIVDTFINAVRW
jgi:hypothetical protein